MTTTVNRDGVLKVIPNPQSKLTRSAVQAVAEFAEVAEAGNVTGYVMVWLDRDGEVNYRQSFLRRLEMVGAVEAAKASIWSVD